jgi:acyl-homoserine-lactone acylase
MLYLHCKRLFLIAIVSFVSVSGFAQKTDTEILWDNYGVPHIYATTDRDLYYAFGWTQMHNHANLLLRLYGQARGRAAEYWGESYVSSDKLVLLFNIMDSAKSHYAMQRGQAKKNLDAFVEGINEFAKVQPGLIDPAARKVLPVTAEDVLAHSARVIQLTFLAGGDIGTLARSVTPGSNAYAIAPSRSASKHAMLVANPHLPWSDLFTFYEAHLNGADFNAYGAALVGMPILSIAFNENLGWTHTVNTIDGADRYELTLRDNGYLLDGAVVNFDKKMVPMKVLQKDGTMKTEQLQLQYSKHGPVMGVRNGKAYAVRIAGLENPFMAEQYYKMTKAKNSREFESALRMMQMPMFNVIYADKTGNILYLFNGNVPKRSEGDWKFWSGMIDGTSSKYIWNEYHSYSELPRVFNPPSGFVQNANDAPWVSTYPAVLKPEKFPAYMAPKLMPLRPQRAINMIKDDQSITFDELVNYKNNTGMEAADRFLDDLLEAIDQYPDPVATKAAVVLKSWDRATNANSRGAVLFARWFNSFATTDSMYKIAWNPEQPITTPDGIRHPQKAVDLLKKAAGELENLYGSVSVAWGDVYRYKLGDYDLPASGGPGSLGLFRVFGFQGRGAADNNRAFASSGDTYVAVTEFGEKPRAQVLLSYGNASQPGSKHIGDQLPLLAQKKMRPALLEKRDVLNNLEKKDILLTAKKKGKVVQ